MRKRTTLKDIAQKVGLTPMAVSLALNNDKSIPQKTRDRILQAAKKMNYYPNLAAQSLRGKSSNIAVFAVSFSSFFIKEIMEGIENKMSKSNYYLHYYSTKGLEGSSEDFFRRIFYGRTADAIISIELDPDAEVLKEIKSTGFPVVVIEGSNPDYTDVITADNEKGGRLAARRFLETGRKNIAVAGAEFNSRTVFERVEGFKKELASAGVKLKEKDYYKVHSFSLEGGKELYSEFISKRPDIDAIFSAAGDTVAAGMMKEAEENGIIIPRNLAVIGFDDIEMARLLTPALTTVRQPIKHMGEKAAEIIMEKLGTGPAQNPSAASGSGLGKASGIGSVKEVMDVELVMRDSG